ncbi:hypothetical protein F2P56_019486 [Juglans regia]|uniref:AAA+ ATPase domain-containing protein n=1 Tax=Juglans regia TaxID=51240 RepID=A0A834CM01_JUGRE|nr:hypothetical protein F2P56_019486 [Juglans regia]
MEEIVIAVLAKIAECTVQPVGRWLCYSCHYKSNMEYLNNQEMRLRDAQKEVERKVKTDSDNGNEIKDNAKMWLEKVDNIIKKLGGGEEAESRNSNPSCLNLKQRHQMSRKAKQMVRNIAKILEEGKFVDGVSHCPAVQDRVTPRNMDYMNFDSRISITKRIMEALGDANINKIGVWGSAGVGKSTLMKEIFRKAKEESLFDEVALANVTESPNLSQIQEEIANMLDLKLDPNCKTEMVRAGHLRARLEKDKEKKILVILDDIWKRLDLEEIGIIPSERCKVLLTSRDRHVLASEMVNEENSFKLDTLGEEEAWKLFEKMAGDFTKEDLDLRNTAIKVAKACGGLPIALVTVSRALKNKNLRIWKDALVQLTKSTPEHDTEIWSPVYSCIQLSYNHLVGRELKSLFLLCAQQGYYISYRDLLRYGFGLRDLLRYDFGLCLFRGIDTLDETRNRLENLVSKLQDACLLLQSPRSSEEFYMHDLVRHVATMIASDDDHNMFVMRGDGGQKAWPDVDSLKRCEALSIHDGDHIHKYSNKIECPKLRYFHVQCKPRYLKTPSISLQGMDKLEDIFFQGMDKLEVLSLTNIQLSSLLPLTNLQTLCLDGCELGDIHWIGELKTLVILSLTRSDISNLPREIGSLIGLRLLDLTDCSKLKVIPPNVLSSLVKLEELYMRNIKVQWEVEGPNNEGKNASLVELKKLSYLITLEIDIEDDAYNLPKDLFSKELERYKICIGHIRDPYYRYRGEEAGFSRSLELALNMSNFQLDFGIKMLLKRTEYIYLDESDNTKSVLYELDREDFQQLKHLHILHSWHLPELRTSFKNLKVLRVEDCEKLRFIFSSSIARGLSLLEKLKITRCNNVGAIFVKGEDGIEEAGDLMLFSRLQTLHLRDLPKLVSFLSTRETNSEGNGHDLQVPLLHHQLSFPSLKKLHLQHLPKIKHVWSNVNGCESLKSLKIEDCGVMEEIVAREDGTDPTTRFLFPSLTLLSLDGLPKLKWFFQGVRTLELPSSKELDEQGGTLFGIEEVSFPSLQTLCMESLPKIKHIWSCGQEPKTFFKCVEQLKTLWIKNCEVLEEIVGGGGGAGAVARTLLEFPRVTNLRLENLKRLKWFYKGVHVSKWPMLEEIWIRGCEKVEIFASGVVSFEETVEDRPSEMSIKQPIFLVDELSFSSLKKLHIWNMHKLEIIWQDQVAASYFSKNIQAVHIWGCDQLLHVFQSNFRTTTILSQRLTRLWISNCRSLESIFRNMEGHNGKEPQVLIAPSSGTEESVAREDGTARHIEFPILTEMSLNSLPKLKWILEGVHTILECPSLEKLRLWECDQVLIWASKFASSSSSQETSQQNQLQTCIQLPNLLELQVQFSGWGEIFPYELVDPVPRLRRLDLRWLPMLTHLWKEDSTQPCPLFHNLEFLHLSGCGKLKNIVPSSVFLQNLTELHISSCDGLINLLTSSTAKTLVQLQKMTVKYCERITEIVAMEDGEENVAITFNKLAHLELEILPNLTHFCSGPYSFGESLKNVIVTYCSKMKPLCYGVSSTPELKGVYHT